MNKLFKFGLVLALASLLGACCNRLPVLNGGTPHNTIRMGLHYGDHGNDVTRWQNFLLQKGYSLTPPHGDFDAETASATTRFQRSHCYGRAWHSGAILETGTVTFATFHKAVKAGMPKYQLTVVKGHTKIAEAAYATPSHGVAGTAGAKGPIGSANERLHLPMKWNCQLSTEVSRWQAILTCLGYSVGTPGSYDLPTQTATGNFQTDAGLLPPLIVMGQVDAANTYAKAKLYCPCTILLGPPLASACPPAH